MSEGYQKYLHQLAIKLPYLLTGRDENEKILQNQWPGLIKLLQFHGLIPFFVEFGGLEYHNPGNDIINILNTQAKKITARNLKTKSIQKELRDSLLQRNIPFVFFKGLYLSGILYQNQTIRPILDIDVLTSPETEKDIRSLLLTLGAIETQNLQNSFMQQFAPHSPPLRYKDILIEIHKDIVPPVKKPAGLSVSPWDYIKEYDLTDEKIYTFNPVFYLFYLCLHAHRHLISGKMKLLWYVDIACLIEKFSITNKEMKEVFELAENTNYSEDIGITLSIVHKHLLTISVNHPHLLTSISFSKYNHRFLSLIQKAYIHVEPSYYIEIWKKLSVKDKFTYISGILFPSITYIQSRFGVSSKILACGLIIINPFRVAFKIIWKLFRK